MTSPFLRHGAAIVVLAAALAVVTGCAAPAPAPSISDSNAPAPSSPAPEPSPTQADSDAVVPDPTCDGILPEATVTDFESIGWTAQEEPFAIGDLTLPNGVQCVWADFDAPASDHLQLFGWAPITPEDAETAQDSLLSQEWIREDAPDGSGVYITENPETTIAVDEEGYGLTYFFTDVTVTLADTKQGLLLIEWPRG